MISAILLSAVAALVGLVVLSIIVMVASLFAEYPEESFGIVAAIIICYGIGRAVLYLLGWE